jgi:cytochrome c oxidase subunit 4
VDHAASHAARPHVLPIRTLLVTAATLLALTALTVAVSRLDLGPLNVVVALAIACGKAAVVALYFMHLRYQRGFQRVILVAAALFAVLFAVFVVFDTVQYQPDLRASEARKAVPAR